MLTPRPLAVGVLTSHRAPGLLELACGPGRGRTYDLVCCLTSEAEFGEGAAIERLGVPVVPHPMAAFCRARGVSPYRDLAVRLDYDEETTRLLAPFAPDLLVLDGYLYLVTAPVLAGWPDALINLHFSDLTARRRDGSPRFPGIRAVRDALATGVAETRATVHAVTDEPDAGAPLVLSWPFPVSPMVGPALAWNAADLFKAYAYAHQQWMLRAVSAPLLQAAIELIATGRLRLSERVSAAARTAEPWRLDERGGLMPPAVQTPGLAGHRAPGAVA